ncbi:MAG: FAD-binding oxidoreductase [Angustibacter sp.]
MTITPTPAESLGESLADLRLVVAGDVLVAGDDGYEQHSQGFNLALVQRPAVVVVAADREDVARAVRFAADHDLPLAVQATGHGTARGADGAVLLVTSRLTGVEIDPQARTARIEAGAKFAAVLPAAQEHGLAPLLGSTTDVGAVGYTLGGGFGWLGRRYGLCSDSALSFELVTADGDLLVASAQENAEVFWALKGGGGGSLGVVTSMVLELYPVSEVYAGNLLYPAFMARDVLRRYRDWVDGADERLTSSVVLMNFPPLEDVPEPLRGQSFVMVRGCWSGELEEGAALVDEWRAWRPPVMDLFGPLPFAAADSISQDPVDPMPAMLTTECLDSLSDGAIDVLVQAAVPAPGRAPLLVFAEIRQMGGAVRAGAAAAANDLARQAEFVLEMVGVPVNPHVGLALEAHLRHTRAALAPYVTGATYLNFTEGHEKAERTASAFSAAHLARLQAVKATLDPHDRFSRGLQLRG